MGRERSLTMGPELYPLEHLNVLHRSTEGNKYEHRREEEGGG